MSSKNRPTKAGSDQADLKLNLKKVTEEFDPREAPEQDACTTQFIRKAAAETAGDAATKVVVPRELGPLSPRVLLSIITYCYAKGVYTCTEIEDAVLTDEGLRKELGENLPDDRSLRKFRRLNGEAIRATLERAFKEAKRRLGRIPPDRLQASLPDDPRNTADGQTSHLAKEAARDRIQKALFIDGMSKDLDF
jgi:hypothetical protein